MLAMVIPMFWIGIYPAPLLARIQPSVIALLEQAGARGALGPELYVLGFGRR